MGCSWSSLRQPGCPVSSDQRYYWLYLNNWLNLLENRDANHMLGHFWTLAVEEQFYLFWPLVVWSLPPRWTLRVAAGGILLASVGRMGAVFSGVEPEFIYRNTLLRADALLAGAVGACLARRERPEWLEPHHPPGAARVIDRGLCHRSRKLGHALP